MRLHPPLRAIPACGVFQPLGRCYFRSCLFFHDHQRARRHIGQADDAGEGRADVAVVLAGLGGGLGGGNLAGAGL